MHRPFLLRALRPAATFVGLGLWLVGSGCSWVGSASGRGSSSSALRKALTFHASFDRGTDADYAQGDPWLYQAPGMEKWKEARAGLASGGPIRVADGEGKYGAALRYERRADPVVYYRATTNVAWKARDWSGSVSFWLRADLMALGEGFCDPLQLTPRKWDDAAFFVEFERRGKVVPFRLGAYADFKTWNPLNRKWEEMRPAEKPLLTVDGPPFAGDQWTHVVITWDRFNTGQPDGEAMLYLNGAQVGAIRGRNQMFTWNPADARLLLGVGYVGWIDDVAVFNRSLTAEEVQQVRSLPGGVRALGKKNRAD
jgi:hypothetical protein